MASCSSVGSSHSADERLAMSALVRLQRAKEVHTALLAKTAAQQKSRKELCSPSADCNKLATSSDKPSHDEIDFPASSPVTALATELQNLWRREKDHPQGGEGDLQHESDNLGLPLRASLQKIGSHEKDELLLHLLGQNDALCAQRGEVAAMGEKIAAQLLLQQHELRQKYCEQIRDLEAQLHQALHCNPQVAALQEKIAELEGNSREYEQKLRFAVQKLQRSRKREKELKMMNDPLWD